MADNNLTTLPTLTDSVSRNLVIEPLQGGRDILFYLGIFPEEIYNKSADSHFYRLMSIFLGNQGVNWLRKNYLDARILLEELGIDEFDLDKFFGNPFAFGRILEEDYSYDPTGLISKEKYDELRAKDARYRNRAIDYMNAARAGTSPLGMQLAARAGLGHDVEIIENYRYWFDIHSDSPMGLKYQGHTASMEEFVILPRREIALNETQRVTLTRTAVDAFGNFIAITGTFVLAFNNESTVPLAYNATADDVRVALEALNQIRVGDVEVTGGPSSSTPLERAWAWDITFTGRLGSRDVQEMLLLPTIVPSTAASMIINTIVAGRESVDEPVDIPQRDLRYLQGALDRLRPWASLPTVTTAQGLSSRTSWNSITSTSEYNEVVRYVTGSQSVQWPSLSNIFWIEKNTERQAPKFRGDLQFHYKGFHNIANAYAYGVASDVETDFTQATNNPSQHTGNFGIAQATAFPFLASSSPNITYTADRALADYPEPLLVTTSEEVDNSLRSVVNGVYPLEYQNLPGVPQVLYKDEQFWASLERTSGTEYLEIDLGFVQAVNFLMFEISRKPVDITISYDVAGLYPSRRWSAVTQVTPYVSKVFPGNDTNPWVNLEYLFLNGKSEMTFTRFIRIKLDRRVDSFNPFLTTTVLGEPVLQPWSLEVRNLRIGRNV